MAMIPYKTKSGMTSPPVAIGTAKVTLAAGDLCYSNAGKWDKTATNTAGPLAVAAQALATDASGAFYLVDPSTIWLTTGHTQATSIGVTYTIAAAGASITSTSSTNGILPLAEIVEFVNGVTTTPAVVLHIGRATS